MRSRESAAERDGSGEHEDGWEIDLSWLPKACTSCIAEGGQCTAKRGRDAVGADEQEKGSLRKRASAVDSAAPADADVEAEASGSPVTDKHARLSPDPEAETDADPDAATHGARTRKSSRLSAVPGVDGVSGA